MRTLSPGSDFFRSHKGALSYLNAHFKLGGDSVKMIFGLFFFFCFFRMGGASRLQRTPGRAPVLSPPSICLRSRRHQASHNGGMAENVENQSGGGFFLCCSL